LEAKNDQAAEEHATRQIEAALCWCYGEVNVHGKLACGVFLFHTLF